MARTDILLDPDNIDAITADGSFHLSTSAEKDPDIRLIPKRARLVLGGRTSGEGSTPDGEIWLVTSDGEEWAKRIGLSAAATGFDEEEVFSATSQGDAGRLKMGRVGDMQPTVEVNAERGNLRLNRIPEEEYPYDTGRWSPQGVISIDAKPAHITVGGGDQTDGAGWIGKSGSMELRNARDIETVTIQGAADGDQGERGRGGAIQVKHRSGFSTVTLDGGTGTLMLGHHIGNPASSSRLNPFGREEGSLLSENGELWLDDGRGRKYGLKAEDGTVGLGPSSDSPGQIGLVLKPGEGTFSVVDGDGNAVFRVDTQNETVQIAREYSQEEM